MASKKPRINWNDEGAKLLRTILSNAMRKTEKKVAQAERVAEKVQGQMADQKKFKLSKSIAKEMVSQRDQRAIRQADRLRSEYAMQKAELLKKQQKRGGGAARVATMAEAAASKGTVIRKGKETPISKKKAAELGTQAKRATSQAKKGNAARRAEQAKLLQAVRDARKAGKPTTAAMARLRAHVAKYGRYS